MSLSRTIFRDVPINTWIDRYETSHQNPVNRVFHTFGIPMIAVSIPLFLLAPLIRGFWKIPLSLFTLGWVCQFLGHAVEGKPPEFLKDWRFLFVGLRWWLRTIAAGPKNLNSRKRTQRTQKKTHAKTQRRKGKAKYGMSGNTLWA